MFRLFGIDPAPSKKTVTCTRLKGTYLFDAWLPHEVKAKVEALTTGHDPLVITWDAPLGLDQRVDGSTNFASRAIDLAVIRWVKHAEKRGALATRAIGVANAASCPHNLLTQHVWGLPVGAKPNNNLNLLRPEEPKRGNRVLAEVHPAVTLAAWWDKDSPGEPLPRYKPGGKMGVDDTRKGLKAVLEFLAGRFGKDFPHDAIRTTDGPGSPDDRLDAWIAWRMALDWTEGHAHPVGPDHGGSYLLPVSIGYDALLQNDKSS
jgi:hypothetical protein